MALAARDAIRRGRIFRCRRPGHRGPGGRQGGGRKFHGRHRGRRGRSVASVRVSRCPRTGLGQGCRVARLARPGGPLAGARGREPVGGRNARRIRNAHPGRILEFREGVRKRRIRGGLVLPRHDLRAGKFDDPASWARPGRFRAVGHFPGHAIPRARTDLLGVAHGASARRGRTFPRGRSRRAAGADFADTGETEATTRTRPIRSPCSRPTSPRPGARRCWWRRPPPPGARAARPRPSGTGRRRDWGRRLPIRWSPSPMPRSRRMLAACGCPPSLFTDGADGTAQREGLRRWHLGTLLPLARLLEHELTARLEAEVRLEVRQLPDRPAGQGVRLQGDGRHPASKWTEALAVTGLLSEDA